MYPKITLTLTIITLSLSLFTSAAKGDIPHLQKQGTATQLIVEGQPFLVRGGELGNSIASNRERLGQYWKKFQQLNMNTVVAPVYWDLIEPAEGKFDFALVDSLIEDARAHGMKLNLLWFGSWKNSMSSYTPAWVKTNYQRFPRARDRDGRPYEILSPFHEENYLADARAYRALMRHIKKVDTDQTVIMMQPENEIGMVNLAREYSDTANQAYTSAVPTALLNYLDEHRDSLTPELQAAWAASNSSTSGSWTEVFGSSPQSEEIFMAWHFAYYTEQVTKAGREEYDLPSFVNAALIRPGYEPGQHVSAGPLPHLIDVWRAAAPSIDFIAPDIYFPNFTEWTERYTRSGNPLYIPEALRSNEASVNALYAYAEHDAMGFSPFGIESISGTAENLLANSYDIVDQLEHLILEHQGKDTMRGFLQISDQQRAPKQIRLGDYEMHVKFEYARPPSLADGVINESGDVSRGPRVPAGGLVIQTGEDEFIFAGIGITITFDSLELNEEAGIVSAESVKYVDEQLQNIFWNNGDQTHQGRHIRLVPGQFSIQKVKLYRYK
ncbi:Beta-galactosidase family [Verrucomicrobiia bacterium DG1235]|nr:Beta-galactosidase family [Verrucomicrobiae bacterium DG1235]